MIFVCTKYDMIHVRQMWEQQVCAPRSLVETEPDGMTQHINTLLLAARPCVNRHITAVGYCCTRYDISWLIVLCRIGDRYGVRRRSLGGWVDNKGIIFIFLLFRNSYFVYDTSMILLGDCCTNTKCSLNLPDASYQYIYSSTPRYGGC